MKKIVLYSSNSKRRGHDHFCEAFPAWSGLWDAAAEKHPDLDLTMVLQTNNRYFLDVSEGRVKQLPEKVRMVILPEEASIADFVRAIEDQQPDLALAVNHPISGYDWNGIRDAVIAETLREDGIPCVCYSCETALDCFDKCKTYRFLKDHGFRVSEAVCVSHELFTVRPEKAGSTVNAYQESVLWKIRKLMPVIIKDATGSGSIGVKVCRTCEEAEAFLLSEAFTGDVIVERLLRGDEYGLEIHGRDGDYIVTPPFRKFSLEASAANDPLGETTLKYGPIISDRIPREALRSEMLRLAKLMGFTGIVNLDLFLVDGEWYILDINSRWSGITSLVSASQGRNSYEIFLDQIDGGREDLKDPANLKCCCQFKIPQSDGIDFGRLVAEGELTSVSHERIMIGGQTRWYNDAVTAGYDSLAALAEGFAALREKHPEILTEKSVKALQADIRRFTENEFVRTDGADATGPKT